MTDIYENQLSPELKKSVDKFLNQGRINLGDREYIPVKNTYIEQGQPIFDSTVKGPVMEHDRYGVPALQPSDKIWNSMEAVAGAMVLGCSFVNEADPLFSAYDMTRLKAGDEKLYSNYQKAVDDALQTAVSVREPPKWVIALMHRRASSSVKIGTRKPERYVGAGFSCQEPNKTDLVLTDTISDFSIGVFPNPAYYHMHHELDIIEYTSEDVHELNYYLQGKFQRRFLSRLRNRSYVPSVLGFDTMLAFVGERHSIKGEFKYSSTDFFFRDVDFNSHLVYFQHLPPVALSKETVYRKSSVYNVYKQVIGKKFTFATNYPLPTVAYLRGKLLYCCGALVEYGNKYLYEVQNSGIEDYLASVERDEEIDFSNGRNTSDEAYADEETECLVPGRKLNSEKTNKKKQMNYPLTVKLLEGIIYTPARRFNHSRVLQDELDPWEETREPVFPAGEDQIDKLSADFERHFY